ncbi:GWxTD domain-containing protein [Roseivirga sp.]|uniref:GWxTD domain-containing protein n=1 Tax=Roseivirga sp. TaxID=1964215 RepID=UPI003B529F70
MKYLLSLSLLLTSTLLSAQQRMSSAELSYLYDQEHEFLTRYKVAALGNHYKVYFNFMLNNGNVRISDYQLSYDIRNSYIDEKPVSGSVKIDTTQVVDVAFRQFTYELEFFKEENDKLMVIDIYNVVRDEHFYLDVPLVEGNIKPTPFLIFEKDKDIPFFSKYINRNYQVRLMSPFDESLNYEISGVENNRGIAPPPFDEVNRNEPSLTALDTLYGTTEGEVFEFYNEGFYTINASDYPDLSYKVLVADEYYPYFGEYPELIQPLIYVSTNDEYKDMRESDDVRSAFEEFVNNTISANERISKDFIKYYFRRIRKSARLFTEDREGWKTDRGMVYQVFGNPIQVFRNEKTELWVFPSEEGGRIRFIFDIVYEDGITRYKLIRGKRYRESWMLAVSQWRTGRIIE